MLIHNLKVRRRKQKCVAQVLALPVSPSSAALIDHSATAAARRAVLGIEGVAQLLYPPNPLGGGKRTSLSPFFWLLRVWLLRAEQAGGAILDYYD